MELEVLPFNTKLSFERGDNLLDTLLKNEEIPVSYSCRSGRCGLCRCKSIEGAVSERGGSEFRTMSRFRRCTSAIVPNDFG